MLWKCCIQYASKFGKLATVATGLEKISFHSNSKEGQCQNVQTTAQLHSSHTRAKCCSKLSKPGFNSTWTMNFDIQPGFRKGRGTRNQIANIRWIIEKARKLQKNIYFCFIDYAKAFDCVDHNNLWKILKEMGKPDHLTCLLRNLYAGQEVSYNWTWSNRLVPNWERSTQGCILLPAYLPYIQSTSCEMPGWIKHKLEDCWEKYQ